jgi:hypothetical protein
MLSTIVGGHPLAGTAKLHPGGGILRLDSTVITLGMGSRVRHVRVPDRLTAPLAGG